MLGKRGMIFLFLREMRKLANDVTFVSEEGEERCMSKDVNQEHCVLTSKHPTWLDTVVPNKYFDEGFLQILLFYVIFSPCPECSTQGRTLQYYGWKDKPWYNKRYLKDKLDANVFDGRASLFSSVSNSAELEEAFRNTRLEDNFFENISEERVAFRNNGGSEYMSLFHHIRCSLAHGRLAMYPTPDQKDIILVMEDGCETGAYFRVNARMVIKKSTLLKWAQIIKNGPQEDENMYYQEVYKALSQDGTLTVKELKARFNETEYAINKAIAFLKENNIISRHNHGKNSRWEVNVANAEKYFLIKGNEVY